MDGKKGEVAAEAKFVVLSFQSTPPGVCPYLVLCARPQTINESSDYASRIIALCVDAAKKAGNAVLLNYSTDGVSCEVQDNYDQICKYLSGKSNVLALPDPNHNAKNARYQLVGGSGEAGAAIGNNCFDVMLLKQAGVAKELIRVDDYASDTIVLRLASLNTIEKLIKLETNDTGNKMVRMDLIFCI